MFGRRVLRTRHHRVFGLEITFRRETIILTIAALRVVQERWSFTKDASSTSSRLCPVRSTMWTTLSRGLSSAALMGCRSVLAVTSTEAAVSSFAVGPGFFSEAELVVEHDLDGASLARGAGGVRQRPAAADDSTRLADCRWGCNCCCC